MQGFASCPPVSRYWNAIHATNHFILAGGTEATAARILRRSACDKDVNQEAIAVSELLKIELLDNADARGQFDRLIAADLKFIPADFVEVRVPTSDDVDVLIARYGAGSAKQRRDLIVLLSVHPTAFSDGAWAWLSDLAKQPDHEVRHVLFRMLTLADSARFGRILAAESWSWDPKFHMWVNDYGTSALIKAETALPFDQMALRLAPWRLLEAARVRGADPAEVRLAAEIFGQVLAAEKIGEPDPGSMLTMDRSEKNFAPFIISVQPRPIAEERDNPMASLRTLSDADARAKDHMRAIETATARIEAARASGAGLYLVDVEALDMDPVVRYASDMVDPWLEGYREVTTDFRRRVRLAETAFLALCEALLIHDAARGAELWHSLRATMATRYLGAAGIDELLHIAFRAPTLYPPLVFATRSLACLSATRINAFLMSPPPRRTMAGSRGSPPWAPGIRRRYWRGVKDVARSLLVLALETLFPSQRLGRKARCRRIAPTFAAKPLCIDGARLVLITGGERILRLRMQSRPMPIGSCFCVRRMRAHGVDARRRQGPRCER
jgi:hypothetical protein